METHGTQLGKSWLHLQVRWPHNLSSRSSFRSKRYIKIKCHIYIYIYLDIFLCWSIHFLLIKYSWILKKINLSFLGKIEGRRRGQQRMRWLDSIADSMDMKVKSVSCSVMSDSLPSCGLHSAGSSVHEILQARILERVAMPFRVASRSRDQVWVSRIAGRFFIFWVTREDPLKEEMATHFSILAWRIPWAEETGGLQSIVSQRVRHGWSD